MAIPPIISNLPIFKLLKAGAANAPAKTESVSSTSDVVEISEAAQKKLQGIEKLSTEDTGKVKEVAVDTREILEENDVALGLDSNFS